MPEKNEDYRKYIEEKFRGFTKLMDANFNNVLDKLDSIEEQTKKTNGRVTKLEQEVEQIKLDDINHIIKCPLNNEVKQIKDDLLEYKFMKKYPKLSLIGLAFIGVIMIVMTLSQIGVI